MIIIIIITATEHTKTKRATEKWSSNWLTVIPLKELNYNLNKKEFRDAIKWRYDWEITDTPMLWACGVSAAASLSSATSYVCLPNADSYRDLTPKQIYKNEKERQYAERVIEIEQGRFTPRVFTTTGGMADEYHSRRAEHIENKKGESSSSAISWIRAKVSFAIIRSPILCLRGSRSRRRQLDFVDSDLQFENIRACLN